MSHYNNLVVKNDYDQDNTSTASSSCLLDQYINSLFYYDNDNTLIKPNIITLFNKIHNTSSCNPNKDTDINHNHPNHDYTYYNDKKTKEGTLNKINEFTATYLLDSGSNINLTNNIETLQNIRKIKPIEIEGINNRTTINTIGYTKPFGIVFYCPTASTNIISLTNLITNAEIDKLNKSIIIEKDQHKFEFKLNKDNLFETTIKFINNNNTTNKYITNKLNINPNKDTFSEQYMSKLKYIDHLHHTLSHPSDKNLLKTIKSKSINLPIEITSEDIKNYRNIYGDCNICIIAKNRFDQKPSDIYRASKIGQKVHCDLFFIQKRIYLITVDEKSLLVTCTNLLSKQKQSLESAFSDIISIYKQHKQTINTLYSDSEINFTSIRKFLNNNGITLSQTIPGNHNGTAERYIGILKEKIRALYHSLPFDLPARFISHMINYATKSLNNTTNYKNDTSPRVMFTNQPTKHENLICRFGQIGLFHNNNEHNKNAAKTNLGIVLDVDTNSTGRYLIYNIDTGQEVYRGPPVSKTNINELILMKVHLALKDMEKLNINSFSNITTEEQILSAITSSSSSTIGNNKSQNIPLQITTSTTSSTSSNNQNKEQIIPIPHQQIIVNPATELEHEQEEIQEISIDDEPIYQIPIEDNENKLINEQVIENNNIHHEEEREITDPDENLPEELQDEEVENLMRDDAINYEIEEILFRTTIENVPRVLVKWKDWDGDMAMVNTSDLIGYDPEYLKEKVKTWSEFKKENNMKKEYTINKYIKDNNINKYNEYISHFERYYTKSNKNY